MSYSPNKGFFKPINKEKYKGDSSNIVYRSFLELKLMTRFDNDPNVIWWGSETVVIPYKSPKDNKIHRYFIDFIANIKTIENKTKTVIIEIKPKKQTSPPKKPTTKKLSNRYISEIMTWGVNSSKWKAAQEFAKDRGYEFIIMTEEDLGVSYK